VNPRLHYHYTTVGHVTVDVLDDRTSRPGGTAFYSALQAARLGLRTLIVTRGRAEQIEQLLAPYSHELDVHVHQAEHTTTLLTSGAGANRRQRLLAWAGPIPEKLALDTDVLHLAPIARESPSSWRGAPAFVGLTPQGLARSWSAGSWSAGSWSAGGLSAGGLSAGGDAREPAAVAFAPVEPAAVVSTPVAPAAVAVAGRCHAIVLSHIERANCARVIDAGTNAGAIVAITAGAQPTELLVPGRPTLELSVPAIDAPAEDLGAGDVFAAAFFVALAEHSSAQHAARFANAAAAVRMSGVGADAIGTRALVERQLSRS
jgi:sugar/nucleoside kinase (ribokinase family)